MSQIEFEQVDNFGEESSLPYCMGPAWSRLWRGVFKYEVKNFRILADGEKVGLFSYAVVKSWIFGNRIVSMPFSDESGLYIEFEKIDSPHPTLPPQGGRSQDGVPGGRCQEKEGQKEIQDEIVKKIIQILDEEAKKHGVEYAELRGYNPILHNTDSGYIIKQPYVKFLLELSPGYEKLRSGYHINLIKNLKKADKCVEVRKCQKAEEIPPLYPMYVRQMREFGSPPLPMEYFTELFKAGLIDIYLASVYGTTAAFLAIIKNGDTWCADLNAGLPEYDSYFPKVKLFDITIRIACEQGIKTYDFMRTRPGTGVYEHKKKWGGKEIPIYYYYRQYRKSGNLDMDPYQKKFCIPRLIFGIMPVRILKCLGPFVRRHAGK